VKKRKRGSKEVRKRRRHQAKKQRSNEARRSGGILRRFRPSHGGHGREGKWVGPRRANSSGGRQGKSAPNWALPHWISCELIQALADKDAMSGMTPEPRAAVMIKAEGSRALGAVHRLCQVLPHGGEGLYCGHSTRSGAESVSHEDYPRGCPTAGKNGKKRNAGSGREKRKRSDAAREYAERIS
jgi:hypothetical protein